MTSSKKLSFVSTRAGQSHEGDLTMGPNPSGRTRSDDP